MSTASHPLDFSGQTPKVELLLAMSISGACVSNVSGCAGVTKKLTSHDNNAPLPALLKMAQ